MQFHCLLDEDPNSHIGGGGGARGGGLEVCDMLKMNGEIVPVFTEGSSQVLASRTSWYLHHYMGKTC